MITCFAVALVVCVSSAANLKRAHFRGLTSSLEEVSFTALAKKPLRHDASSAEVFHSLDSRLLHRRRCFHTTQVTPASKLGAGCPDECPLWAQNQTDTKFCSFQCVPATVSACMASNPEAPVPDVERGFCRGCLVSGCSVCASDGTDHCIRCKDGRKLVNGKCPRRYFSAHAHSLLYSGCVVVALLALVMTVWAINMAMRPIINEEGLQRGLQTRSRAKLHMHQTAHETKLWDLFTPLWSVPVAGPGVLHSFRYQILIIIWAMGVLIAWLTLAWAYDMDFLEIGTRDSGDTPRDHCIIVVWGWDLQQRLMHYKYTFLKCIYCGTFILFIAYGIMSIRTQQRLDAECVTHKDFCAMCEGLPIMQGTERVEENIHEFIEQRTGERVLGVSVAWDFVEKADDLMKVIDGNTELRLLQTGSTGFAGADSAGLDSQTSDNSSPMWITRMFYTIEDYLLRFFIANPRVMQTMLDNKFASSHRARLLQNEDPGWSCGLSSSVMSHLGRGGSPRAELARIRAEVGAMTSTDVAFIIFDTEGARDNAVKFVQDAGGLEFRGSKIRLNEAPSEPQSVNWKLLTVRSPLHRLCRILCGCVCVLIALFVWARFFYYPYASSVLTTDYGHGRDPNLSERFILGLIVVGGNAVMYLVCGEISDRIGFRFRQDREKCYMLMYTFACVVNVLLDLGMTYVMALKVMVAKEVMTHDGKRLDELDNFWEIFRTYAMRKSLGSLLADYAFPSTFLIPFLAEPFVAVIVPFKIMYWMVRSNSKLIGSTADEFLKMAPMDLGRYSDLLLNMMLAVLIFFLPGGYVVWMFAGLIVSHIWIYCFDHYRVLRAIPACDFSCMDIEWWGQWMLSIPCGILLAACSFYDLFITHATEVIPYRNFQMLFAFLGHIMVHTLILLYVVPLFRVREKLGDKDVPYATCSENKPDSWFSSNPVHCLRSQYIYEHKPPCDYFILGKDYLLRPNPELHLFYKKGKARHEETYSFPKFFSAGISSSDSY